MKSFYKTATLLFASIEALPSTVRPLARIIPTERLHVSEPDPQWFGNGPNPTADPSWTSKNWLTSRFHFSFAEYVNYGNSNFGVLRVMNDDLVQPHRGFGDHTHSNMEIVTYIVEGELTHRDSMGTTETLGRGSIQFMSAGTGVRHSEFNHGGRPLRFIQTWIVPSARGIEPKYGSCQGAGGQKNQLRHLVSSIEDDLTSTPVKIHQEVDGYAAEIALGQKVVYQLPEGKQAYLLCIEGGVRINGKAMMKYDGCEIVGPGGSIEIEATDVEHTENGELAHILMFVMRGVPGSCRSDF